MNNKCIDFLSEVVGSKDDINSHMGVNGNYANTYSHFINNKIVLITPSEYTSNYLCGDIVLENLNIKFTAFIIDVEVVDSADFVTKGNFNIHLKNCVFAYEQ